MWSLDMLGQMQHTVSSSTACLPNREKYPPSKGVSETECTMALRQEVGLAP
jgi:hypothetical protein